MDKSTFERVRCDAWAAATATVIEIAALIAEGHKGAAKAARIISGYKTPPEALDAVEDEERGEDIAAVEIARKIRAIIR